MGNEAEVTRHLQKSMYFADGALMRRFFAWCVERRIAPGQALQSLVEVFIDDLELQRHQVEITLPVREVKF